MRPIRDILIEEYWTAFYRKVNGPENGIFGKNQNNFIPLETDAEDWYADTFLFEKDGTLYLFVEKFNNKSEMGTIAVSELKNGKFTKPIEVLKENFHLSYPVVFEENGTVYMMPETNSDNCIQVYRAEQFPLKWVKDHVIVNNIKCVDSINYKNWIITGELCPEKDKSVNLLIFNKYDGRPHAANPIRTSSFDDRGAGSVVTVGGKDLRPTQDCTGSIYGQKVIFKEIIECSEDIYSDKTIFTLKPDMIPVKGLKPLGVHTYTYLNGYEVIDVKLNRFNPRRIWWIIKKKIKK